MQNIRIAYQTHDADMPVTIEMPPSEYYDPLESEADTYEADGIPKYLEPHRFVPVQPDELKLVVITEPRCSGIRELRIQYLDGLRSYCVHSIWPDGTEELIHNTDISSDMYHLIRTQKDRNGYWSVVMNTYADKSNEAHPFYRLGRYDWEQLRSFWRVFAERRTK